MKDKDQAKADKAFIAQWDRFQRRKPVAIAIMLVGLFGVFAVGFGLDQFGNAMRFGTVPPYLFFGSIWLGIFGGLYAITTITRALAITVCVSVFFLAVYLAGRISRGEL